MRPVLRLITRLREASTRQLWITLLLLAGANAGMAGYVAAYMPIVRVRPVCVDRAALWFFGPGAEVEGEMAYPFLHAYHNALLGLDHLVLGRRIYVTIADWFRAWEISKASSDAAYKLLSERTGVSQSDLFHQRAGVPDFDEVALARWPPCGGMRKLAIEGGEWAYRGPELRPEIARGRIVPLPHLTDPLLFEPVLPRGPAAVDGERDAGDAGGGVAR